MGTLPKLRRADKRMSDTAINDLLSSGYCGHIASVDSNGWPYVCPLLFVWRKERIWLHNSRSSGHLLNNVQDNSSVCFCISEAGDVFSYGRYECDTSIAYKSVVVFGEIEIIEDTTEKESFFESLMNKYSAPDSSRPKNFFPRLDETTVYALKISRITGKETELPAHKDLWPMSDNTKSPNAQR
ncbi:MAG: pyridoxamine 5'-phosphate oxidase family protein [Gammaproteobacteria bacterium]|nr:pyridoxamine 5'-phosphate oxidase family protein [Gammaproteobacteria bacterium]